MSDAYLRSLEAQWKQGNEAAGAALAMEHERAGDRAALEGLVSQGVAAAVEALVRIYEAEGNQAALCKLGYHQVDASEPMLQCVNPRCGAREDSEPCLVDTWCVYCEAGCGTRLLVQWVERDYRPNLKRMLDIARGHGAYPDEPRARDDLARMLGGALRR